MIIALLLLSWAGLAGLGFGVVWLHLRIVERLNDVTALVSLNATLRRLNWNPPAFFTDGAAASPTLQHTLLKSLLLTTPDSILELGSGQSTKLLSLYRGDHPECYVLTLEESEAWAGQMSKLISHDYRFSPVTTKQIQLSGRSVSTEWYRHTAGSTISADSRRWSVRGRQALLARGHSSALAANIGAILCDYF